MENGYVSIYTVVALPTLQPTANNSNLQGKMQSYKNTNEYTLDQMLHLHAVYISGGMCREYIGSEYTKYVWLTVWDILLKSRPCTDIHNSVYNPSNTLHLCRNRATVFLGFHC